MAITTLDPRTALVVIDLQQGIVSLPTVHPPAQVIAQAAKLAQVFRKKGLPVVLVNGLYREAKHIQIDARHSPRASWPACRCSRASHAGF